MYLELYRKFLQPLRKHILNKKPDYIFTDYSDYFGVTHKEDIKLPYLLKKIETDKVDLSNYDLVIHIPYTNDMFNSKGRLSLLINDNPVNIMDYYYFVYNEYLYIFLKKTYTSVTSVKTFKSSFPMEMKPYNDTATENQEIGTQYVTYLDATNREITTGIAKYKIEYSRQNYFTLTTSKPTVQDVFRPFLDNGLKNVWMFIKNITIDRICLYKHGYGFITEDVDKVLEIRSNYIRLKTENPKANDYKVVIFYDGPSIEEFIASDKNKEINELRYEEDTLLDKIFYMNDNLPNRFITEDIQTMIDKLSENYDTPKAQTDEMLLKDTLSFNYDLFMLLYRQIHKINIGIPISEIKFVDRLEQSGLKAYKSVNYTQHEPDRNKFMKISFINIRRLPIEIFHNFRKFTDVAVFYEYKGMTSIVYIKTDVFLKYYGYNSLNDLDGKYINIILRPDGSEETFMKNINAEYNGVMIPSKRFYNCVDKLLYDDGYPITEHDIEYNTLPPSNMLVAYPQKKLLYHEINALMLPRGYKPYTKSFFVKCKNLTAQDFTDVGNKVPNKFISGNHMVVDYIDFTYLIKVGEYTLTENVDYVILSPKLIKFYRIPIIDNDNDYIKITLEFQGKEFDVLKQNAETKSILKKIYELPYFVDKYNNKENTCLESFYYPDNYESKFNRNHQMLTKYFCTESVVRLDDLSDYGEKWKKNLQDEYPEYWETINGEEVFTMTPEDVVPTSRFDIPRHVTLVQWTPLNDIIYNHIMACSYLDKYGYTHGSTIYVDGNGDEQNKKFIPAINDIDIDKVYHNFEYNINIPLDYIIIPTP